MSPILISGSLAFDSIMDYQGKFQEQIIPEQLHNLNLVFMVPTMRREFGGCAGNIAYNMKALGGEPFIVAAVGKDFHSYREHLKLLDINQEGIHISQAAFTAQAFITNDEADNQIISFHPGAMQDAHLAKIPKNIQAKWGIVSPNGKEAMMKFVDEWSTNNINTIFDPGQGLPMFSGNELIKLIQLAHAVTVNEYELTLMCEKTALTTEALAKKVANGNGVLLVTLGSAGAEIYQAGKKDTIPAIKADSIIDPTGCGDAFRGGLLYALNLGKDWLTAAKVGAVVAGIKIASAGGQNHRLIAEVVSSCYENTYGEDYPL